MTGAGEQRLPGGQPVRLRPLGRADAPLEQAFLARLSAESLRLRFLDRGGPPDPALVKFLTEVDGRRHVALACTLPAEGAERLIGQARYVVNPDGRSAEFGIVVADDWRRRGVARLLLEALLGAARRNGVGSLEGLVLHDNRAMLQLARAFGFDIAPAAEDAALVRVVKRL